MKKFAYTFIMLLLFVGLGFSQSDTKKENHKMNREWKEAMEEVEEALKNIEIPNVDVDRIMDEVRAAMPTRDEMDEYKEIVSEAVRELKEIDFTELERAMEELGNELEDIFQDNHWEKSEDKKIYRKNRKI